jgi:cytochrome bd-type quinol oxidase subunit 2
VTVIYMEKHMHIANKLAILAGSAFLVVGLSLFINPYVSTAMNDLVNNQGLLWVTGLVTFVMGTVILALYNTWSKSWRVLVTIIGWLAVIKGAVLMLFPQVMKLYVNFLSNTTLTLSGIYAIVLGGVFLFLGIKRK